MDSYIRSLRPALAGALMVALGAAAIPGAAAAQSGVNLRDGAVFSATNNAKPNKIVASTGAPTAG